MNLYRFAGNDAIRFVDYLGWAVVIYEVLPVADSSVAAPGITDVTTTHYIYGPKYIVGKNRLLELKTAVNDVPLGIWTVSVAAGRVKWDSEAIPAGSTKAYYTGLIDREISATKVYYVKNATTAAQRDAVYSAMETSATGLSKSWDIMAALAHGYREGSTPTGQINFNGELVSQTAVIEEFRAHAKPPSGKLVIGSCYRTWSAGVDYLSTEETVYLSAAAGGFKISGDGIDDKYTKVCDINVRPFKTMKKVGVTTFLGDEQYETYLPGTP